MRSMGKLSGSYRFSKTFTSATPNDTRASSGLADLLLVMPTTTFSINDYTYRPNTNNGGAFVQVDGSYAEGNHQRNFPKRGSE